MDLHAIAQEASRALETSQRKDRRELPEANFKRTATASGSELPMREELIDFNPKAQSKRLSNADRERPMDSDARLASMNDEASDLAQKGMRAVDLENVLKRPLVSARGYNLGSPIRSLTEVGMSACLQGCRSTGVLARESLENDHLGAWGGSREPVRAANRDSARSGSWRRGPAGPNARLEHSRFPAAMSPGARSSLDCAPATRWH